MKKIKKITFVAVLLMSAFTFYQCTNDDKLVVDIHVKKDFESFKDIHKALTFKDTIKFTINNPTIENILVGEQGVRLIFPPNSCITESGSPAVAPFTVKLIEVFRRGDMISNSIHTFAGQQALVSGGMFWVGVTDANGKNLKMSGVKAVLPYQTDAVGYETSMLYFVGVPGPILSWGLQQSSLTFDRNAGSNGEFTIWNIIGGWSNCDAFYQYAGQTPTQFTVKVTNITDYTDTKIFFALDEYTNIAGLSTPVTGGMKTYENSFATGATGKIIAISLVDGMLKFASKDVTITGNDVFTLEVAPGTIAELEALMNTLD